MDSTLTPFRKVGDRHGHFVVTKVVDLQEINCLLREVRHEPSGATVLHLANDDPENAFVLSFRTTPATSNGVAHILEHTVLCGSEKYPVRDPFFAMTRRSLNTFMNAWTGQDFTAYPAATQVQADFYNLLDVYVDAVFKPKLDELSFLQEGHRFEFEEAQDPDSPLKYKGIVFNEMKGVMSSPDARFWEEMGAAIFPNVTYGVNSGGDPQVIPDLSYQELLDFHSTYYHPARCLYYFYGNLSLRDHLDYLEERILKDVKNPGPLTPIPKQGRFSKAMHKKATYPIAPDESLEEKAYVSLGWLTCHVLDQEDTLALNVLETVLMDNDAAPLKKALLKSGLCKSAYMSLVEDINELPLILLMKGCDPKNAEALEKVVRQTLIDLVDNGISPQLIESALHQLEFSRSEITGDGIPYGISLFLRAGLLRQHGGAPEDALRIHSLFEKLRSDLKNPLYLTGLIERYLLSNPHCVRLVMEPNPDLDQEEEEAEQANLTEIRGSLSHEQVAKIVDQAVALKELQETQEEESLDCLPKVSVDDVDRSPRDYPLSMENAGGFELLHHDAFTNQIVYADVIVDLPQVSENQLSLIQLFLGLMGQMGTDQRGYDRFLEDMQLYTGGIDASLSLYPQARNPGKMRPAINIGGKTLHRNAPKFFEMLIELIQAPSFKDKDRFKELLKKHFTGLEQSLSSNALRYANNLSASKISASARIGRHLHGLEYFYFVKDIMENFDRLAGPLLGQMELLSQSLLHSEGAKLVITTDRASYEQLKAERFYGLVDMPLKPYQAWEMVPGMAVVPSQGRVIASQVAFTSQVTHTVSYTQPESAPLALAAQIFNNQTLHRRIREQGGAYGGGSAANPLAGTFKFYAYRDPNLRSTLQAFHEACEMVAEGHFGPRLLEEAKLEMVQKLDCPISPGSRGLTAYSWLRGGLDLDTRSAFRHRLLNATQADVQRAVKEVLIPRMEQSAAVSFSNRTLLERENLLLEQAGEAQLEILKI